MGWTTRPIRITDPDMVPATTGNANTDVSNPQDVTALEVRAALMEIPNHVFDDVEVNWKKLRRMVTILTSTQSHLSHLPHQENNQCCDVISKVVTTMGANQDLRGLGK